MTTSDKTRIELLVLASRTALHDAATPGATPSDVDWIVAQVATSVLNKEQRVRWFSVFVDAVRDADTAQRAIQAVRPIRRDGGPIDDFALTDSADDVDAALDRALMALCVLLDGEPSAMPHDRVNAGPLWMRGYLATTAA